MKTQSKLLAAAVLALAIPAANAALVMDPMDLGASLITEDFETVFGGPEAVAVNADVTIRGVGFPPASLTIGDNGFWALGENGAWSLGKTFAANNAPIGGLLISFNGKTVDAVGGFFNYLRTPDGNPLQLLALDVDGNPLEGHSVTIMTSADGFNEGAFYGIRRSQADIGWLMVTAPYVAMDDLAYTAPVPEPTTYAMVFAGLALLTLARQRSKRG